MKRNLKVILSVTVFFGSVSSSYALDLGFRHDVSISGGIASPSASTSLTQNPAGLSYNQKLNVDLATSFSDSSLKDPSLEGALLAGNGSLGGGLGVIKPTTSNSPTFLDYGFALHLNDLKSAIGLSGMSSTDGSYNALNAGVLLGSTEKFRLGASAHDLTHSGSREWGAGMNYDVTNDFSFVTDATLDTNFGNLWVMPGIAVRTGSAALTMSYGLAPSSSKTGGSYEIPDGFAAGGSLRVGNDISLQAYYKQLNYFMAELTIGL